MNNIKSGCALFVRLTNSDRSFLFAGTALFPDGSHSFLFLITACLINSCYTLRCKMFSWIGISIVASVTAAAASDCPDGFALNTAPVPDAQKLTWESCRDEGRPNVECSTLQVPLDYLDPSLGTLRIPVVRLPADGETPTGKSIFMNPGGPGESGIESLLNSLIEDGSSSYLESVILHVVPLSS